MLLPSSSNRFLIHNSQPKSIGRQMDEKKKLRKKERKAACNSEQKVECYYCGKVLLLRTLKYDHNCKEKAGQSYRLRVSKSQPLMSTFLVRKPKVSFYFQSAKLHFFKVLKEKVAQAAQEISRKRPSHKASLQNSEEPPVKQS